MSPRQLTQWRGKAVQWLAVAMCVQVVATVVFLSGFVLPRQVNTQRSERSAVSDVREWYGGHRVVVVIIDALRYDMVVGERRRFHSLDGVGWLLRSESPTTTAQRLKGMTTGSIPAFMEITTAFNSDEVTQDSILNQLRQEGKTAAILGDDTWTALFPPDSGYWTFNQVFPSFNVWDLDTVDNGVKENVHRLFDGDELKYDLNVLHFLGVDHAGHRYGPYHPEMDRKIRETDLFLTDLKKLLQKASHDNKVALLVLGDHGMTEDGQHGGGTPLEINSVLHVELFADGARKVVEAQSSDPIDQVSLVPTLSAFLGCAVPFSNLGVLHRDLLRLACGDACDEPSEEARRHATALLHNARQIHRGLVGDLGEAVVSQHSPQFTSHMRRFEERARMLGERTSGHMLQDFADSLRTFITPAHEIARSEWAKMHPFSLYAGVVLSLLPVLYYFVAPSAVRWRKQEGGGDQLCFLAPLVLGVLMASNSFVVMEEKVVGFLCVSLTLLYGAWCRSWALAGCAVLIRALPLLMIRTHRRFGTHMLSESYPVHDLDSPAELLCTALAPLAFIFWHGNASEAETRLAYLTKTVLYLCVACSFSFKVFDPAASHTSALCAYVVCLVGWTCGMKDVWAVACLVSGPRAVPTWAVAKVILGVVGSNMQAAPRGVVTFLCAWFVFFCVGHQTVVSALDFGSAFVGFTKLHHNVQGVLLIGFNTYSCLLLNHERPTSVAVSCMLLTTGCMFAAALHREHLMVWEVFAPRMLYACAVAPLVSLTCLWRLKS